MGKAGGMGTERDFAWGDGHTMQGADDVLLSCALETCLVLRTDVSPINSIKKKRVHNQEKQT